ncbi:MAG: RagB/SusD family nutrient uptake outer membrane protein [Bacteroides sp.]|nr:RagB/SusD family nutrient uptake outer membrane protein [Bacteroides sp.]
MKKIYTKILCFLVACSFVACDDFLSEYSQDMVVAKTVDHLDEVLLGSVYMPSFAVYNPSGSSVCGFLNILDDDINTAMGGDGVTKRVPYNPRTNTDSNFGYFAWQAEVGMKRDGNKNDDSATWNDLYKRINYVNVILDEIVDMPHETEDDLATYNRVQGEAHFLRAQFYFMLANLYGKPYDANADKNLCVPLKLTPYVEHDVEKETQFQRATVKEIYDQVLFDLGKAVDFLTLSPQNPKNRFHRASIEAVNLLLSRVYLYTQSWELAEKAAAAVIASSNYRLAALSTLEDGVNFLTNTNAEVIFSQGQNNLPQSNEEGQTPLSGFAGNYCVSADLANLYDQEKDRRYACFFGITPSGGQTGSCDSLALHNKFEAPLESKACYSDVFGLRLSEAYLNQMEACAMLGHTDDANDLLNNLRRERIDDYDDEYYTGEELVSQIRDERRKELCFEGHRWFDLRRYSVNTQYPYSKAIIHVMNVVNSKGNQTDRKTYRLEANDLAYTFAIPEAVIEFDKVPMENNLRETRLSLEELYPETEEDEEI